MVWQERYARSFETQPRPGLNVEARLARRIGVRRGTELTGLLGNSLFFPFSLWLRIFVHHGQMRLSSMYDKLGKKPLSKSIQHRRPTLKARSVLFKAPIVGTPASAKDCLADSRPLPS
jgi:hypothetical protein